MAKQKYPKNGTVSVRSIHNDECPNKEDRAYVRCGCPKEFVLTTWNNEGTTSKKVIPANTCDYQEAQGRARRAMLTIGSKNVAEE